MKILFLFLTFSLFSVDFDCALIGSSPFSLFEALYQYHSGKRVLVLEQDSECGGAWKAITACGIPHVDLGCHTIGQDKTLQAFLEQYAGCRLVQLDNPLLPYSNSGSFYFSHGCHELIDCLLRLIERTDIVLLLNHKVENIDLSSSYATLQTPNKEFTASKVIVTSATSFCLNRASCHPTASKYYHLYLLIQDPSSPRFTYCSGVSSGISRMMNLSHFAGLTDTGRQLVVLQIHSQKDLQSEELFLADLKKHHLLDEGAYILSSETYTYEQSRSRHTKNHPLLEILATDTFTSMSSHIARWKQVLPPAILSP